MCHLFTVAEGDPSFLLVGLSQMASFNISTHLPIDFDLPSGDFITIQSEKSVMAFQHKEGHYTDTGQGRRSCLTSCMTIAPSLKYVDLSYTLNHLN